MKIALAQYNFHVGNIESNFIKIKKGISEAKEQKAEIIVFPELALLGYPPLDLLSYDGLMSEIDIYVEKILAYSNDILVVFGAPSKNMKHGQKPFFNSAFVLYNGEIISVSNKTLLPSYDIFDEDRFFQENYSFKLVKYKGRKIAISICEDLWFDQMDIYKTNPIEKLKKLNPDFMINLSASPFDVNKTDERIALLTETAKHFSLPIFYVNQVGGNTDILFDGASMAVNSQGEICAFGEYFKEHILFVDDDALKPIVISKKKREELLHDALVLGIKDYCQKSGFKQAIIGLSGGIDSALVAVLAVRALGKGNVRVLLMPSEFSSDHSLADAIQLSVNLQIRYDVISIKGAYDQTTESLKGLFDGKPFDVAEENIQSRHRGLLLMALSNKHGQILLNTTNKSEMAVGYGTLYGDMCGGISVLGDVYKTEIYSIAHYINREVEIIPTNSIKKPPSAELRPDQKDTDSLPEYDILDRLLYEYIELRKSKKELLKITKDETTLNKVVSLVNKAEYKRYQAAPVLRVSTKAFGVGRQVPIVAKYDF